MLGKFRSLLFVCILSTLFLCLLRVELVYAEIASGTSGTCSWVIDDDGVHAYTHGGSGEGAVFDSFYGPCTAWNSCVGYIIRTKNMAESIQIETIYVPPIVVESVDEVVKEPVFFVLNRRILQ